MKVTSDYIPGCYRNFPQKPEESLRGYFLRLAEANGYSGITSLIFAATGWKSRRLGLLWREILVSKDALGSVGRMAIGDGDHLIKHHASLIEDGAMLVQGRRMDDDAFLDEPAQICPYCLEENQIIHEDWDLASVTVCPRHKVVLLDSCHCCGAPVVWSRSSLLRCDRCGADYRGATPTPASLEEAEVSADFAAVAPFRFMVHGNAVEVTVWDAAFRIFKCLALTRGHWTTSEFPNVYLRNLPLECRHSVVKLLATARNEGTYKLSELVAHLRRILAPLTATPKPLVLEKQALLLLHGEVGLPWSIATAMISTIPVERIAKGYELFHGRPPTLANLVAVENFLGVDNTTLSGLIRSQNLHLPFTDESFDIDDVLNAQRYLQDGLLTLPEQHAVIGAPIQLGESVQEWFLETWNRANGADKRVEVRIFLQMQLQLTSKFDESTKIDAPVSLGTIASLTAHPSSIVVRGVMLIMNGTIAQFMWSAPFRWSDLQISETVVPTLLASARLA